MKKMLTILKDYGIITISCLLYAFSFNCFFQTNDLAMGGFTADGAAAADNAPGNVDMTTSDYLQYNLLVPEAQWASVTEAASLIHAMNANTFTCGAYKVADVAAFAEAMKEAILNNQWMCGFPERLLVVNVGGVVVVAFGVNDAMTPFQTHLAEAYAGAETLIDEPIA